MKKLIFIPLLFLVSCTPYLNGPTFCRQGTIPLEWLQQLEDKQLSRQEFVDLVAGRQEVLEMREMTDNPFSKVADESAKATDKKYEKEITSQINSADFVDVGIHSYVKVFDDEASNAFIDLYDCGYTAEDAGIANGKLICHYLWVKELNKWLPSKDEKYTTTVPPFANWALMAPIKHFKRESTAMYVSVKAYEYYLVHEGMEFDSAKAEKSCVGTLNNSLDKWIWHNSTPETL